MKHTKIVQIWPNHRGNPDVQSSNAPMAKHEVIQFLREEYRLPDYVFRDLASPEGQATFKDLVSGEITTLCLIEFNSEQSDHERG